MGTVGNNVVEATNVFAHRRMKSIIKASLQDAVRNLQCHRHAVGLTEVIAIVTKMYEEAQTLSGDLAHRVGLRLHFCDMRLEQDIIDSDSGICMLLGTWSLQYRPHEMLDLDDSEDVSLWEGNVIHVCQLEVPHGEDEAIFVEACPWDKDQSVFIGVFNPNEVHDLTLPIGRRGDEHKTAFATIYTTLFNALPNEAFRRVPAFLACKKGDPEPRSHVVHAVRAGNRIIVLFLDIEEMSRLDSQYVDYIEFHGLETV